MPRDKAPGDETTSVAGLAACLALLEGEARALGRPLAAHLIAAAGAALMEDAPGAPAFAEGPEKKRLLPMARR